VKSGAFVGNPVDAAVIAVAEPDGHVILDQHDPIEDPAPHIARPLEAVEAAPKDRDGMVPFGQPAAQVRIRRLAQQRAADGGNEYKRHLHLDKGGFRRLGQGACGGARVWIGRESRIDLAYVQGQAAQGAVASMVDQSAGALAVVSIS
jgi:hypothetical protein